MNIFFYYTNFKEHTWDPAGIVAVHYCVNVSHIRIVWSYNPPPLNSTPRSCGEKATAFIAALCYLQKANGSLKCRLHNPNLLSLPPEASYIPSELHDSPHTSILCPTNEKIDFAFPIRISWLLIVLSRDPALRMSPFQARAVTCFLWLYIVVILAKRSESYIFICPYFVPMASVWQFLCH